ncbi:MAG: chromosome segregation protein SMC [bacterium]|nr:chromosome segregation protein SMC [bacterium]
MRLLRLELQGFKSFPDKVSIDFVQEGVSIIVGPNGCGKSNTVDAIRWVLGEQSAKHLRGAAMEDVIFSGSSSRAAVGLAAATLVFSNPEHQRIGKYADFAEISVTRKLYRTGESQYLINKASCRLSDIRDLFMDTGIGGKGYSIIEQGKIDRIVTSSAIERRSIIDEAAGIVKFKSKKAEAQKRFAQSRQNLDRVEDVLGELKLQEEKLVVQVVRADEYLTAKGRMERLSQLQAAHKWAALRAQGDEIEAKRAGLKEQRKDLELQLANLSTKKSGAGLEQVQKQDRREQLGGQVSKAREELIKLDSRIETDQETLRHLDDWHNKGNRELDSLQGQIQALLEQEEALLDAQEALQVELSEQTQAIQSARESLKTQQNKLEDLNRATKERQGELVKAQLALGDKKGEVQRQADRLEEARARGSEAQEALIQAAERLIAAQEQRGDSERDFKEKTKEKEEVGLRLKLAKAKQEEKKQALEVQNRKIEETERDSHKVESRLESLKQLEQNHEDFAPKIKAILDHLAGHPERAADLGFVGPLADLVEIGGALESWAENLLGRFFNLLIFESHYHLPQIKTLMEELGVEYLEIYFLDLCEQKTSNLDFLIPWHDKPQGLFLAGHYQALEKKTYQIEPEDLTKGRNLLLTDKSLVRQDGVFQLGLPSEAKQLEGYLKRQQEFHQLGDQLKQMKQQLEDLVYDKGWIKEELDELEWEVTDLTQEDQRLAVECGELGKELERFNAEADRLNQEKIRLEEARDRHQAMDEELAQRRSALESEIGAAEAAVLALSEQMETQQAGQEDLVLELEFKKGEVQAAEIGLAGSKEKAGHQKELLSRIQADLQRLQGKLTETKTQTEDHGKRRELLEAAIDENRKRQPELVERIQILETEYRELSDLLERQGHEIREIEETEKKLRALEEGIKEQSHQLEVKLAQLAQEGAGLENALLEDWAMRPEEVLRQLQEGEFDAESAPKELSRLKAKLAGLGDVNLGAKKEYEALKERLDFLEAESKDLSESITALEESISKIDAESRRRFDETFQRVNREFKLLFPRLFGGGDAFLKLSNPEDLLDSGVEIIAQPPGKKLQNMTLLSGGEKAMTALALIFSIFQFKPSPFCLLDEVDAPLDDANNRRFNDHVRALTANSQFIIITHNKKTMEIGDALFGVTMEEPGASKIVAVDFERGQKLLDGPRKKGA